MALNAGYHVDEPRYPTPTASPLGHAARRADSGRASGEGGGRGRRKSEGKVWLQAQVRGESSVKPDWSQSLATPVKNTTPKNGQSKN